MEAKSVYRCICISWVYVVSQLISDTDIISDPDTVLSGPGTVISSYASLTLNLPSLDLGC